MASTEFPDDNRLHVQQRGKLAIKPSTQFCKFRKSWGLDGIVLRNALEHHRQFVSSQRTNGIAGETPGCDQPDVIIIYGYEAANRYGRPYKLILAAWQGNAAWVGTLSRSKGSRPGVTVTPVGATPAMIFRDFNGERLQQESIELDWQDLSAILLKSSEWRGK